MAKNGRKRNGTVNDATLRKSIEFQRIGNRAVHKAQEENRRLGVPNWYSIGGVIVSDREVANRSLTKDSAPGNDALADD